MPNAQRRTERSDRPRLLIAVGGNAIHPGRGPGTVEEQREYAARTGRALLPVMRADNELVITHGNGPVVGKILMRQVLSRERVPPMSMDVCVAHSQGGIAYLLMQSLENTLREAGNDRHVVCLLTQVEVDADDPAFGNPTKPIGFFYDEAEAQAIAESLGWTMRDDAGRGWRCVVPSPRPRHIVDISLIEAVAKSGAVVIAGGGGGIPVVRDANGVRRGVEGVIDKDLSSAHMAHVLGIRDFMILTSVERVQIGFGTPRARGLDEVRVGELRRHFEAGEFAEGSMGPKVEAAIRFIDGGGRRAVIAHLDAAEAALARGVPWARRGRRHRTSLSELATGGSAGAACLVGPRRSLASQCASCSRSPVTPRRSCMTGLVVVYWRNCRAFGSRCFWTANATSAASWKPLRMSFFLPG